MYALKDMFRSGYNRTMESVERAERMKYDYGALTQKMVDKCPADYPWMKEDECLLVARAWANMHGSLNEQDEIHFDEVLFGVRDEARRDGRIPEGQDGFERYCENHPVQPYAEYLEDLDNKVYRKR